MFVSIDSPNHSERLVGPLVLRAAIFFNSPVKFKSRRILNRRRGSGYSKGASMYQHLKMQTTISRNAILFKTIHSCCLVCEKYLKTEQDVVEHMELEDHRNKLGATIYVHDYSDDRIRKVKRGYFCEFCNKCISTMVKLRFHVSNTEHVGKKCNQLFDRVEDGGIILKNVYISKKAWNGIIDDKCVICDLEFDNLENHITTENHLFLMVQSSIDFGVHKGIFRKLDNLFQCLTCNEAFKLNKTSLLCITMHFLQSKHRQMYEHLSKIGEDLIAKKKFKEAARNLEVVQGPMPQNARAIASASVRASAIASASARASAIASASARASAIASASASARAPALASALASARAPALLSASASARAPAIASALASARTPAIASASALACASASALASTPARATASALASASVPAPASAMARAPVPTRASVLPSAPTLASVFGLASAPALTPVSASARVPASAPARATVSALASALASAPGRALASVRAPSVASALASATTSALASATTSASASNSANAQAEPNLDSARGGEVLRRNRIIKKQSMDKFITDFYGTRDPRTNHIYVIINNKFIINILNFHFINNDENTLKCDLCEVNLTVDRIETHKSTAKHEAAMRDIQVISLRSALGEFLREVRPHVFQCGFCNFITKGLNKIADHLSTDSHDLNKSAASKRLREHNESKRKN